MTTTETTRPTSGRPVAPTRGRWHPVPVEDVSITGGFWARAQRVNATALIVHAQDWMERLGWIGNFDAAVEGRLPEDRQGREFSDSEVYKLMEAMAWEVGRTGDEDLDRRFRALTERVARVQEPDGYLNTMFGRPGQRPRYSNLEWGHELYCAGHLIQAAVARSRTTGPDRFVEVALRLADHVCREFGPDGRVGLGGHPEIETALAELSRETGELRYLEQARLFVERRGRGLLGEIPFGPAYFQDDVPVREAEVMRGHAVRALYLASGTLDVAVETGDQELLRAVQAQLARTVSRRTYLTGGMGAHHEGESFGEDYELPPDRAYAETCAGVAAVQASHRLLLATGGPGHADLEERILYNLISAAVAPDGKAFFYTNTLQLRTPGEEPDPGTLAPRAASGMRAPWFFVSCCPTNIARTLASLGGYVATVDDRGLQLHHFAEGAVRTQLSDGTPVAVEVVTDYPDDGVVRVRVTEGPDRPWALTLRVPAWASGASVRLPGGEERPVEPGYEVLERGWRPGDELELRLPVRARWTWPHPRVDAVRGQVAVERGPLVYCLESADLGADVATARVLTDADPVEQGGDVHVPVRVVDPGHPSWPYGEPVSGSTTDEEASPAATEEVRLTRLVPYHQWGNRGPGTMRVWMPVASRR